MRPQINPYTQLPEPPRYSPDNLPTLDQMIADAKRMDYERRKRLADSVKAKIRREISEDELSRLVLVPVLLMEAAWYIGDQLCMMTKAEDRSEGRSDYQPNTRLMREIRDSYLNTDNALAGHYGDKWKEIADRFIDGAEKEINALYRASERIMERHFPNGRHNDIKAEAYLAFALGQEGLRQREIGSQRLHKVHPCYTMTRPTESFNFFMRLLQVYWGGRAIKPTLEVKTCVGMVLNRAKSVDWHITESIYSD